jgi:hypothetical protein
MWKSTHSSQPSAFTPPPVTVHDTRKTGLQEPNSRTVADCLGRFDLNESPSILSHFLRREVRLHWPAAQPEVIRIKLASQEPLWHF